MATKPRVMVAVLTGTERQHWVCPGLVRSLLQMAADTRYSVHIEMLYALTPTDYARNTAVKKAVAGAFDWLLMIDNDVSPNADPLSLIGKAPESADVITLAYGLVFGDKFTVVADPIPGATSGEFCGVRSVGTGIMALRKTVWEKIPRQWFKIVSDENSDVYKPLFSEDIYFCNLARQNGLNIFIHQSANASHWHSVDLTKLVPRVNQ
jgi:hypothetical protein